MRKPTMSIRAMLAIVAFIALACVALVRANAIWASVMFSAALAVILFAVLAAILRRGAKQAFWIGFALFGWGYVWMAHSYNPHGTSMLQLQTGAEGTLASTRVLHYLYYKKLENVRMVPIPVAAPTGGSIPQGTNSNSGGTVVDSAAGQATTTTSDTATGDSTVGATGSGAGTAAGSTGGFGGGGFGGSFGPSAFGGGGFGGVMPPGGFTLPPEYPTEEEFTLIGHSLFTVTLAFIGGVVAAYLYNTRDRGQSDKSEPVAKS